MTRKRIPHLTVRDLSFIDDSGGSGAVPPAWLNGISVIMAQSRIGQSGRSINREAVVK